MSDNKFCFIICTNNPVLLDECIHYIQHLVIPEGYTIDLLTIGDAASMTSGYQEAMERSDAKYKIYLHQDVFILNKNFLADLLAVFDADSEIGMIGMVGYERVSEDGIMWHQKRIGAIYQRRDAESYTDYKKYRYSLSSDGYNCVAVVDGLLMATARDFPWNTEELQGFDFYDAFQSMEFLKRGYKIAVPVQRNPWCLHDDNQLSNLIHYDQYRQIFCRSIKALLEKLSADYGDRQRRNEMKILFFDMGSYTYRDILSAFQKMGHCRRTLYYHFPDRYEDAFFEERLEERLFAGLLRLCV